MRRFHYVLLEIKLERGLVIVLDSRRKDPETYADMTKNSQQVSSIDHYRTISATFCSFPDISSNNYYFFVLQGLETVHHRSSGTAEGAAIYIHESKYY